LREYPSTVSADHYSLFFFFLPDLATLFLLPSFNRLIIFVSIDRSVYSVSPCFFLNFFLIFIKQRNNKQTNSAAARARPPTSH